MSGGVDCFACLFVFHVCDSGYASLGDSETIALYNHIKQAVQRDVL